MTADHAADHEHLLEAALETGLVTNPPGKSPWHGETHWKSVALVGLWLARHEPTGYSLPFVYTFALLHDLCRVHDSNPGEGPDPEHGARASTLFARLVTHPGAEDFSPYSERTLDMIYALEHHVGGEHARDHRNPNVGLCWDADRLTLPRVGITPENRYLTTAIARTREAKAYGMSLALRQLNGHPFPRWAAIRQTMEATRWP